MPHTKTASWVSVRKFFPDVREPLFHATRGPSAAQIALNHQGLKSQSGASNFGSGNAVGISMSRNLDFLLRGNFGNVIFVFDAGELGRKFKIDPVAYGHSSGWEDEFEERVFAKAIPASLIKGVIFLNKLHRFEAEEWKAAVSYPVVHRDQGKWEVVEAPAPSSRNKAAALIRLASENPVLVGHVASLLK